VDKHWFHRGAGDCTIIASHGVDIEVELWRLFGLATVGWDWEAAEKEKFD
jgi:hypothetical protein